MNSAEIRRMIDEVLAGYPETERARHALESRRFLWQVETALRMIPPSGVVLDLGAGHSPFAPVCAMLGLDVTIIDDFADPHHHQASHQILDHFERTGVRVVSGDVFSVKLPFDEDAEIDLITAFDAMEHWHRSPKTLFTELCGRLAPGGVLWVGGPNCANLRKRISLLLGRCKWSQMEDWYEQEVFRGHVREPDVDDLAYIAHSLGFSSFYIEGRNWIGYLNERTLVKKLMPLIDPLLRSRPGLCSDIYLYGVK